MGHTNNVTIFTTAFTCLPKNQKQQLHFYTGYYSIEFWDAKSTFNIVNPLTTKSEKVSNKTSPYNIHTFYTGDKNIETYQVEAAISI